MSNKGYIKVTKPISDALKAEIKKTVAMALLLEWGTEMQMQAESKCFDLFREAGWDAEQDDEFYGYQLKATTPDKLSFGLKRLGLSELMVS